jgi:hypothetical protein
MFKDRLDGYQTLELSMKCAADWMKPNSQRKFRAAGPRLTPNFANTSVRGSTGPSVCGSVRKWRDARPGDAAAAYLSQQGERKALGKSLEEGCDHQTTHEDLERPVGNEGPPGQRSAVGRACSRSELCRKADRSRKRRATLMSEAGNIPAPAAVCTTSR